MSTTAARTQTMTMMITTTAAAAAATVLTMCIKQTNGLKRKKNRDYAACLKYSVRIFVE
jgi:hypothetical protein